MARSKTSPTARTLKLLRDLGYTVDVVERYIAAIRQKKDFIGIGDLIAFNTSMVYIVQTTSAANRASRRTKIMESEDARRWLTNKARGILLICWQKKVGKLGKRGSWASTIEFITDKGGSDNGSN